MDILKGLKKLKNFDDYIANIKNGPIVISGLSGMGEIAILAATIEYTKRPICFITYNEIEAERIIKDLSVFINEKGITYFPKREITTYSYEAGNNDTLYKRIETLNRIYRKDTKVVITTIEAVMQSLISKDKLYENILNFEINNDYDLDETKQKLIDLGYQRANIIDGRGQFSVKGDILDISIDNKTGIRIEFWGDTIDRISSFDISSQRSKENLNSIEIMPAHEFLKENPGNVDLIFNDIFKEQNNLFDYLQKNTVIISDEIEKIEKRQNDIIQNTKALIDNLIDREAEVPQTLENIVNNDLIIKPTIYFEQNDYNKIESKFQYEFKFRDVRYFRNEAELIVMDLKKAIKEKKEIIVFGSSEEGIERFKKLISDKGFEDISKLEFEEKLLSSGFEIIDQNILVLSGEDLFGISETKKKKRLSKEFRNSEKVVFADLEPGDFVVHRIHGIGEFLGINTIKADGITRDYIKLRYKNDDILYIPTDALDTIRKYIGGGDGTPRLSKMGGKEWANTKETVKKNLKTVAKDLIELYAKRQEVQGFAFSKDTPWQQQFEESFQYQETDDQLRSIEEVKKDMEMQKPMDRLLCGDVGYGKTEVAMRAAFKAIMDHKQVAYLVPTTVLAEQQYREFSKRMDDFGVRVELLNRFKTQGEQARIVKKLKLGEIDIVVGTHRILSKDVEFKDLGLLIVDEEHRFGVKDKEKIKKYKTSVDVLTMTATPIPRTLHMSIVGVRDMSVIYEPPQMRKPVQTYVLEYDSEVVREAILREIERKGQVFYLFNKVQGIEKKAMEIERLVPEAKVAVAHGQMTGKELEDIMFDFVEGKYNVLVCTTILESGIDIPNANTIIVENADRLGLAQLYQIRGRVGRSDRQAYSYITYHRDKMLNEAADKRLKAIKEFTEFGSGFKIAMRDLEIRGAGSLLGEVQSGHMEQVGYDTYCKLLSEVINEIRSGTTGEEKAPIIPENTDIDTQIDLNISAYIPETYIEDESQKIDIYQDIALCKTEEDITNIIDEIVDRFGNLPTEVENLIEVIRIKQMAGKKHIVKISQKKDGIMYTYDMDKITREIVLDLIQKYRARIRFSPSGNGYVTLSFAKEKMHDKDIFNEIKEFLK